MDWLHGGHRSLEEKESFTSVRHPSAQVLEPSVICMAAPLIAGLLLHKRCERSQSPRQFCFERLSLNRFCPRPTQIWLAETLTGLRGPPARNAQGREAGQAQPEPGGQRHNRHLRGQTCDRVSEYVILEGRVPDTPP